MREHCILTMKDFTILEAMLDNPFVRDIRLIPVLKRKLSSAIVMFREDLPGNVASLNCRVSFRVNGKPSETRVLSHGRMTSPIGMLLPVTTLRGLALLGLTEGQEFVLTNVDDIQERIVLEAVHYQREREMQALSGGLLSKADLFLRGRHETNHAFYKEE